MIEVNSKIQPMQENDSEKLKALTKVMLVSMVWRSAGLLEFDKKDKNQEDTNQEKEQNSDDRNLCES